MHVGGSKNGLQRCWVELFFKFGGGAGVLLKISDSCCLYSFSCHLSVHVASNFYQQSLEKLI